MQTLFELLRYTARPMTPPRPYGAFHLIFFAVGIALTAVLTTALRRISERAAVRLYAGIGVALIAAEAYKQLFYIAAEGEWRADLFPFQLCSVPMYICVAIPFLRGRARRCAYTFLSTYALLGGAASYISPDTMCRPYVAMTAHSFLWHMTLIFLGVFTAASGRAGLKRRDFADAAALYLALCAAAFSINLAFHASHPEVNMFYLGPAPSALPVCRDITRIFGWGINSIAYMLAVTAAAFLIHEGFIIIKSPKGKHKNENFRASEK